MIARIWHGWTHPDKADAYEALLRSEILPDIAARGIAGFERVELFRRPASPEVEFIIVTWFSSLDAARAFASDFDQAAMPFAARALLARFDGTSQHYEVREAIAS